MINTLNLFARLVRPSSSIITAFSLAKQPSFRFSNQE